MIDAIRAHISGRAVPISGNDVDTDRIIPARFLKEITFEKMGDYLFADARFTLDGKPKAHPLNDPRFEGASIMVVERNFGCGSSREHAPQSIMRYGIQAIIGESFAEIFAGNCKALGVPVMTANADAIAALFETITNRPSDVVTIDLAAKEVRVGDRVFAVELPESRRQSFLMGTWDSTALLRQNKMAVDQTASQLPYMTGFAG